MDLISNLNDLASGGNSDFSLAKDAADALLDAEAALREALAALNGAPNTEGLHHQIGAAIARCRNG